MLTEIKQKYYDFSDAVISEIYYKRYLTSKGSDDGTIEVVLRTENNEANYEIVKLIFSGIKVYRFIEAEGASSLIINKAFLNEEAGIITFDFFPLIFATGVKEDVDSDFIIKCKKINYEVLKLYPNGSEMI